ncbi:hypothetical protein LY76DRAFT_340333 [Colletotrichum caudatum]|nr:hypothetical protein LY76DRAFT_340333 [Colletotrichum caudatum]
MASRSAFPLRVSTAYLMRSFLRPLPSTARLTRLGIFEAVLGPTAIFLFFLVHASTFRSLRSTKAAGL